MNRTGATRGRSWTLVALGILAAGIAGIAPAGAAVVNGCLKVSGLNGSCPTFVHSYDSPNGHVHGGADSGYAVAVSPKGDRLFVAGWSQNDAVPSNGSYDFLTVAYSLPSGNVLWAATFDGPKHGIDSAQFIAVSPDSRRLYVTGGTDRMPGETVPHSVTTVAYDAANGHQLWKAAYASSATLATVPAAQVLSRDGSRLFVGLDRDYVGVGVAKSDYGLLAYNTANGRLAWSGARIPKDALRSYRVLRGLAVSPDGSRVYATGSTGQYNLTGQYLTVAYRATGPAAGQWLWTRSYTFNPHLDSQAYSTAVSPDGSRIYVAGLQAGSGASSLTTVAYDRNGNRLRVIAETVRFCSIADWCWAYVQVSPDGKRLYVADSDLDAFAHRSSDGALLWSDPYQIHPVPNHTLFASDFPAPQKGFGMRLSRGGDRMYLFGSVEPAGSPAYGLFAINAADGTPAWSAAYNDTAGSFTGAEADTPSAIAVSPDSRTVYLTGSFTHTWTSLAEGFASIATKSSNYSDVGTIGYAAGG